MVEILRGEAPLILSRIVREALILLTKITFCKNYFLLLDVVEILRSAAHVQPRHKAPSGIASRADEIFRLVLAHGGDDAVFVNAALAAGVKGIVHVGTGHGNISKKMETGLFKAAQAGVIVVRASRTGAGPVLEGLEKWQKAGFIPAGTLNPQKARILLQLALTRYGQNAKAVARCFARY